MGRIVRSVDVDAPPDVAFALLTDLDRIPEWATIAVDTRDVSSQPPRVGCTFKQTLRILGRELDSEWRITELEPGRRVAYEASAEGRGSLRMRQSVTPRGKGSTIELEADYTLPEGFLAGVVELAAERLIEQEADRSLAKLRELLDG